MTSGFGTTHTERHRIVRSLAKLKSIGNTGTVPFLESKLDSASRSASYARVKQ